MRHPGVLWLFSTTTVGAGTRATWSFNKICTPHLMRPDIAALVEVTYPLNIDIRSKARQPCTRGTQVYNVEATLLLCSTITNKLRIAIHTTLKQEPSS